MFYLFNYLSFNFFFLFKLFEKRTTKVGVQDALVKTKEDPNNIIELLQVGTSTSMQ